MDKPYEAPRGRLLPTLVVFVFVLGVLYTLFLVFQRVNVSGNIKQLENEKVDVQAKIDELRAEEIEELFVAQKLKDLLEDSTVEWSKVVRSVQDLTPVAVFLTAYTIDETGEIQVSGLGDSFGSVADIISSLQKSSDFANVFVPSVTAGTTADGQPVVTFSLKLDYLPQ
ncbi:MAG: PilN domain-containing protein [Patescibacteria group bacterium]